MELKEKFGKLVLLQKLSEDPLGATYRAARLKASGLDRIVTLLRYSEAISTHPEAALRLMEEARAISRQPIPGVVRVVGIGRVEQSYYCSYELAEGRSLRAVIDRAGEERFPFAAENALMVASRTGAVLEQLHGRRDENGRALIHGFLRPSQLVVSWEGDVQLLGLGAWPSLRGTGLLGPAGERYLAPEQVAGEPGDPRSDVYSLALVLLETLTQSPPEGSDPVDGLATARFVTITGEEEPLPDSLEALLRRALSTQPSSRYESMGHMRQAIDSLLFSGDFTPTTFNLAYFMHTLFRGDMESEAAALEEARQADYTEFLPSPAPDPTASGSGAAGADETLASASSETLSPSSAELPTAESVASESDGSGSSRSGRRARPRVSAEGSGRMFARAGSSRPEHPGLALAAGLVLAVLLGGGAGYLYFVKLRPLSAVTSAATLSPEASAALTRVRELEAQLAALQEEKAQAVAEAEARAREEMEASPSPRPAASDEEVAASRARREARAREEARRRELDEQARREAEIRRLEEEMRAAETVLVAEQSRVSSAEAGGTLPAVLPPPPTPVPTPPPVSPGQLVSVEDPEIILPQLLSSRPLEYPPAPPGRERPAATVVVRALVDESGRVAEARVVESSGSPLGFDAEALKKTRSRRYRPATKRGVPVKVWLNIRANFPAQ